MQIKPLLPSELPASVADYYHFDKQFLTANKHLSIERHCVDCLRKVTSLVGTIRYQLPQKGPPLRCRHCCTKGALNAKWQGGRSFTSHGYIRVRSRGHPYADRHGQVLEHRLVMEQTLGRYLLPAESVHHKNGIRHDNRPENLELWTQPQPIGIRMADYHCPGCRCHEVGGSRG